MKEYPNYGFTLQGAKDACERLHKYGTLERRKGSGRPKSARTEVNVEKVRKIMEDKPDSSVRDTMRATGLKRWATRSIINSDLELTQKGRQPPASSLPPLQLARPALGASARLAGCCRASSGGRLRGR